MCFLNRVLLLGFLLLLAQFSAADGLMMAKKREAALAEIRHALISEPAQKAIIFYNNRLEKLFISPKYEGSVERFVWLMPVPSPPKVEIADPLIFNELAQLVVEWPKSANHGGDLDYAQQKVILLEGSVIGDYDVSILKAKDGKALIEWLNDNGYVVPALAIVPIEEYVKERWTFVACKIHDPNPARAEGLRSGTLAPLKLTFRALKPVYPLRLSSANPEPFGLLVYIILPAPSRGMHIVEVIPQPSGTYVPVSPWKGGPLTFLEEDQRARFPTLARLATGTLEVYEAAMNLHDSKVNPEDCNADIRWEVKVKP